MHQSIIDLIIDANVISGGRTISDRCEASNKVKVIWHQGEGKELYRVPPLC
jgi:hypothetical protein